MSRQPTWPPVIHQSPSGKDFIRVMIAGKQERLWLGPAGSDESRRKYARLIEELRAGQVPGPRRPDLTVEEVVAKWNVTAPLRYRPDSREPREFGYALAPLLDLYGPEPAAAFGPKALKAVRQRMTGGGISRKVVNRRVTRLKTLFKWAAEEELIPGTVYQDLRAVRALPPQSPGVRETPGVPTVTWEGVKRVYRHCARVPGAMLLVQWFTGMRSEEVRLLRACDIDATGDVWRYRPPKHKNLWRGQGRDVAFGPKAQKVLRRWLRLAPGPEAHLFDPRLEPRGRARKDYYTDSAYGLAVGRAAERAGVDMRCYSARHGARDLIGREMGDNAARAALGQKSISSTMLYGRLDYTLAEEVARRLG